MKVAYLVNQYPKTSHTFIRREILALERLGVRVQRLALRGWDADVPDAMDRIEQERTAYVLRGGAAPLLRALLRALWRRPRRFGRALRLALASSRGAERPWPVHLIYLAEACVVAESIERAGSVHLHAHFGTNAAEVAMLARALGGPPYSFTVHGPEEFDKPQALGLGEKMRRAAFVVAISSFGRSQLYRWLKPERWAAVEVVHCGIDRAFSESAAGAPPANRRLVCVGRLCEQKGQLLLVEAMARLAAAGAEPELVLAGDGEMRAEIEARCARLGLGDRVRITGWIDSDAVRRELEAARALVLPSFAEGLPVVIMEAMALGRPVVSTLVAGIPELVVDGVTGWLVPAGDVDALTNAIAACLKASPEALADMGRLARARVLERHDADVEAAKLRALFERSAPAAEAARAA